MDQSASLIQHIESPIQTAQFTPLAYRIKPGDTLQKIIRLHYGISPNDPRYKLAETSVKYFNANVSDPNRIYSGDMLRLMPLSTDSAAIQACDVPIDYSGNQVLATAPRHRLEPIFPNYLDRYRHAIPSQREEEDAFWLLAWLEQNYGLISTSGAAGFNVLGGVVSQNNNAFVAEVKNLYQQYQAGMIDKGQYDYRRRKALQTYAKKLGPFEKLLFKGQTAQEAIRISRSKAVPATAKIDAHLDRLTGLSKVAKYGGVALTVAGVGVGCYQIAQTDNQQKKNEIFVETVASTISGVASGAALTLVLASNPVGWGLALVLGVGAAVASYQSGKLAANLYNARGQHLDLVNMTNVDQLCN